eukprot:11716988-Ditylum_brightwellii.AAC.2
MLEEALPRWMLIEIKDRETGLNNANLHDIFDHAFDRKGQIDDALVDEYTTTFYAQLDMAQEFNGYDNQSLINRCPPRDNYISARLGCLKKNTSSGNAEQQRKKLGTTSRHFGPGNLLIMKQ